MQVVRRMLKTEINNPNKIWAQEDVDSEVLNLKNSILDSGWDDVIYYKFEMSGTSTKDLFHTLLNQSAVIDLSNGYSREPINVTGIPVTFGGLKEVQYPNVSRVTNYRLYDPNNSELEEVAQGLLYIMLTESVEKAEQKAIEFMNENKDTIDFPEIYNGFFYSLTPVMCGGLDDKEETTN